MHATIPLPIVTLPKPPPQPISVHVHSRRRPDGWWTIISRVFRRGEGTRCRLCPRSMCNLDEHGHCLVEVPCYVPDELAPLFPLDGDTGLDGPPDGMPDGR